MQLQRYSSALWLPVHSLAQIKNEALLAGCAAGAAVSAVWDSTARTLLIDHTVCYV